MTANHWDVIIIGAGHAGCEAALAAARAGCRTLVLTPNLDRIGFMPCNPSIGGPGKSQIVAEIDALGGAMARVADMTAVQTRELNSSKGPAVRAIRHQCDKTLYALAMKEQLETQERLSILQDEAVGLVMDPGRDGKPIVTGVELRSTGVVGCASVVVTAGTFLRARMISGEQVSTGGRAGDAADGRLSTSLADLGLRLKRFKTGTPPRLDARSLDISRFDAQPGDDHPLWLSRDGRQGSLRLVSLPPAGDGIFASPEMRGGRLQLPCFQTSTNEQAHDIIRENIHRAPMYNGSIEGTGPRYCPSIEDKVGRFAHKSSHPVFVEPEGWRSHEVYIQGLSTSLPADVQELVVHSIPGMENARITRYGYAVEYDALDATELLQTLECRRIDGLFMAGQVNGTSGYEEAGGQGLIAGANAAARAIGASPLTVGRTDGYIGVMIDDLTSLSLDEPYRMLTSRAEYRLILRSDTADARLSERACALNLVEEDRRREIVQEEAAIQSVIATLGTLWLGTNDRHAAALLDHGLSPANRSMTALDLARRPGTDLGSVIDALRELGLWTDPLPDTQILHRTGIAITYSTFIDKELRDVERQRKAEHDPLDPDMDYANVTGLRVEAAQKLNARKPLTVGQATRVGGVTAGDISALLVFLTRTRHSTQATPVGSSHSIR